MQEANTSYHSKQQKITSYIYVCMRDVEATTFELLLLSPLALLLPSHDDVIFAQIFLILKFMGKIFFQIQNKLK